MFSAQDVDRELKALLSVSPSPDFEARVLQRIDVDRPVRVGLFSVARGLKTAGLPIAASVVIVAGLLYAMNQSITVVEEPGTQPVVADAAPPVAKTAPAPPPVKAIDRPGATVRASARAPRGAEPQVIVPVNQMEAVRRLVRAVNEGRIPAPTARVDAPLRLPTEVVVAPLVVDPIQVPAVEPDADALSPIIRGH